MRLTTTQVSLIAAGIALAAPAITYRANARLDRDRWVRDRRSEAYIDALATLGRIAAYVAHSRGSDLTVPNEQWRVFQARMEAFASPRVLAIREAFLTAWNGYRAAMQSADAAGDWQSESSHRQRATDHASEVARLYQALITQIREELRHEREPGRRRWIPLRRGVATRSQ